MDREKYVDESWKESAHKDKEKLKHVINSKNSANKLHVKPSIKQEEDAPIEQQIPHPPQKEQSLEETEHAHEDVGDHDHSHDHDDQHNPEINFINYISSLGFQALIFLGQIPHPATNAIEKNVEQAKFIIDTLAMLKEKTKGNLNRQEENLLTSTVYELQMKYVEVMNQPI